MPCKITPAECERLADDLVLAFDERDAAALQRLNAHYRRSFSFDDLWAEIWRRVYAFRQRAFRKQTQYLTRDEARGVIAQDAGFSSWAALTGAVRVVRRRFPRTRPTGRTTASRRAGS